MKHPATTELFNVFIVPKDLFLEAIFLLEKIFFKFLHKIIVIILRDIIGLENFLLLSANHNPELRFVICTGVRLDYQPLFGKGARAPPPNTRLDSWTLALLISTNKKSACLNQAGCINYLPRSSKEVVRHEERWC